MGRIERLVRGEDGAALLLVLGALTALSIVSASALAYASSNEGSARRSSGDQIAYAAAEGGINNALAVLYNMANPLAKTELAFPTAALGSASVTYGAVRAGNVWTITSTGSVAAPGRAPVRRRLKRTLAAYGVNANGTLVAWNRIFHDDPTSCLVFENITVPSPIASRGSVCLNGTARVTASVTAGGSVALEKHAAIGAAAAKVARVDVAGGCSWSGRPRHSPCGPADQVFATAASAAPKDLVKPSVDFAYWYERAAPGPKYPCTEKVGVPPVFDNNGAFDRSVPNQELTPSTSSYECRVRNADGQLIGELSWNHATHVLRIAGTVFVDGDTGMRVQGQTVNYQGRATLYVSGIYENRGGVVCAGGNGNTNCKDDGMSNWDPATNLLVLVVGAKAPPGLDVQIHQTAAAFQGAVYTVHDCRIGDTAVSSGPLVCNRVIVPKTASLAPWPPLTSLLTGQVYGGAATAGSYQLVLGPQQDE